MEHTGLHNCCICSSWAVFRRKQSRQTEDSKNSESATATAIDISKRGIKVGNQFLIQIDSQYNESNDHLLGLCVFIWNHWRKLLQRKKLPMLTKRRPFRV
eukprot:TRINITY_DN11799_c0_g1_i2.p6 TRINITY_DN11799_c0_g1~~TRINITY_DN11799_c0_g1_i2.p6  ORF type:complete len:100 (-),score=1.96 TRINITY_DN11799_c0_g1_i2:672-971(-)